MVGMQIGNFAVWINNDTEYEYNIEAFSKTYKKMVHQLPFFIWRDASVQHFQVRSLQDQLAGSHLYRGKLSLALLLHKSKLTQESHSQATWWDHAL